MLQICRKHLINMQLLISQMRQFLKATETQGDMNVMCGSCIYNHCFVYQHQQKYRAGEVEVTIDFCQEQLISATQH